VSGRPHLLLMHERYVSKIGVSGRLLTDLRLIEHFLKHEGVEFVTMAEMADEFKRKQAPAPDALMPAEPGLKLKS
jgi:hypothetical protein